MRIYSKVTLIFGLFLLSACIAPAERKELYQRDSIRLPMMVAYGDGDGLFRWELRPAMDSESPTGYAFPQSCSEVKRELSLLLPIDLHAPILTALSKTPSPSDWRTEWESQDFLDFNALLTRETEDAFRGHGGFYWKFRDWVLSIWGFSGIERRPFYNVLCGDVFGHGYYNPAELIDVIVIELALESE